MAPDHLVRSIKERVIGICIEETRYQNTCIGNELSGEPLTSVIHFGLMGLLVAYNVAGDGAKMT